PTPHDEELQRPADRANGNSCALGVAAPGIVFGRVRLFCREGVLHRRHTGSSLESNRRLTPCRGFCPHHRKRTLATFRRTQEKFRDEGKTNDEGVFTRIRSSVSQKTFG